MLKKKWILKEFDERQRVVEILKNFNISPLTAIILITVVSVKMGR